MESVITQVATEKAPKAIGPYVQGNTVSSTCDMVYTSGSIGLVASTGQLIDKDSVEKQARQALDNLKAVLEEAGSSMENVVKTMVFLSDMSNFAEINKIYAEYFTGENKPARACVAAKTLPLNCLFEIEAIAVKNKK